MDHTRHIGIFNASQYSVTLIGAGGIGAMSALALAKMGVGRLVIYDEDVVDQVNIPVQFHKLSDIGKPKAAAIEGAIQDYVNGITLTPVPELVCMGTRLSPAHVTISAVDSIKARKDIWMCVRAPSPPVVYRRPHERGVPAAVPGGHAKIPVVPVYPRKPG
jgi:tRNA A37 threonylcarbamoyladenosine dehydratase